MIRLAKTLRIMVLFTQKFVIKLSKIKYGFGIRDRGKTYYGSRIRIRNTAVKYMFLNFRTPGSGSNYFYSIVMLFNAGFHICMMQGLFCAFNSNFFRELFSLTFVSVILRTC